MPPTGKVERDEGGARCHTLGQQGFHLELRAGRRIHPYELVVLDATSLGVFRVDLHKVFLLQFGQPRVRTGLIAAAFVLDQAPGGENQRKVLADVLVLVLEGLVQRVYPPEIWFVGVSGIFCDQIRSRAVNRFAVLRDGIGEVPHHGARLGVAEWMATMNLHHDALDATRQIGFPVLALGSLLLILGQFAPPAEFFQEHMIELGIARGDIGTH